MTQLPLSIYIGPTEETVLYKNEIVAGLVDFTLDTAIDAIVKTHFTITNCFPRPSGHSVQDRAMADVAFPLRIYVGDAINEMIVRLNGKPFGPTRSVYVKLSTTQKRIIRITTDAPPPKAAEIALLDLGVEIIVQTPEPTHAVEDTDANL